MSRRVLIGIVAVLIGALTYLYVLDVIAKRRGNVQIELVSTKARHCEEAPTSRCFAELAVLHLPFYARFEGFDQLGSRLRHLGFGDLVDARTRQDGFEYAETDRHALRLYELLLDSVERFGAEPPHPDPFVYSKAFYRLLDDFPGIGLQRPDIIRAEQAALARRGPTDLPQHTRALLGKWRESLDAHGDKALDWLFYTSRARTLGETDEARRSLSKAIELGTSPTSDWTVVNETWQLYGIEAALSAVANIPDTNHRASTYLNLANRLLTQGDRALAVDAFQRFVLSYDEDEPVRLATAWRRMQRSAAVAAYRLGDTDQALVWADKYARGSSFAGRAVNAIEAAELYVDVGAYDEATAKAYEAIAHAPQPGQTAPGPWLSTVSTTPFYNGYVGRAIGVFCKAGKFSVAFSLTEKNPDIGSSAVRGCRVAMEGPNPKMTLERLTESLHLRSSRQLQEVRAAALVEAGQYEAASLLIRSGLSSPPAVEGGSLGFANLSYLRLAVAMRDERLTRDIMQFIATHASSVSGKRASELFATAATYTHKWPDGQATR